MTVRCGPIRARCPGIAEHRHHHYEGSPVAWSAGRRPSKATKAKEIGPIGKRVRSACTPSVRGVVDPGWTPLERAFRHANAVPARAGWPGPASEARRRGRGTGAPEADEILSRTRRRHHRPTRVGWRP